jgi:hypothetical protein
MEQDLEALTTALRVLRAVNQRQHPEPTDLAALRHYAPLLADNPPDKLACEIILHGLGERRTHLIVERMTHDQPPHSHRPAS